MIIVHAFIEVKDGTVQEFLTAMNKCVVETRKEPGCRYYTPHTNTENPLKFVIVEEWDSKAALDEHMKLPHFIQLGADLKDLLAAPLDIKIFEAKAL